MTSLAQTVQRSGNPNIDAWPFGLKLDPGQPSDTFWQPNFYEPQATVPLPFKIIQPIASNVVQCVTAKNPTTNGGTAATSFSVAITALAGHRLLIEYTDMAVTAPTLTPTSTGAGSFSAAPGGLTTFANPDSVTLMNVSVWTKPAAGGSETITITQSTATTAVFAVRELTAVGTYDLYGLGIGYLGDNTSSIPNVTPFNPVSASGTASHTAGLVLLTAYSNDGNGGLLSANIPTGFVVDGLAAVYDAGFNYVLLTAAHQTALTTSTAIPTYTAGLPSSNGGGFSVGMVNVFTMTTIPQSPYQPQYQLQPVLAQ